jgi:hypothetical protein
MTFINSLFSRKKIILTHESVRFLRVKMWTFYALKRRFFRYLATRVGILRTQGIHRTQRIHRTHSTQKIWKMKARDKHRNSEDT